MPEILAKGFKNSLQWVSDNYGKKYLQKEMLLQFYEA